MSVYFGGPGYENHSAPGIPSKSSFDAADIHSVLVQHSAILLACAQGPSEWGRKHNVEGFTYDGSNLTLQLKIKLRNPVPKSHPDHHKATVAVSLCHNALCDITGTTRKRDVNKAIQTMRSELERQLERLTAGNMTTVLKTEGSFQPQRTARSRSTTRRSASNPPPTRPARSPSAGAAKKVSTMLKTSNGTTKGYKSGGKDYIPDLSLRPGMYPKQLKFPPSDHAGKELNANLSKLTAHVNKKLQDIYILMGVDESLSFKGKIIQHEDIEGPDGKLVRVAKGHIPFETHAHKRLTGADFEALQELHSGISAHVESNTGESELEKFYRRVVKTLLARVVSFYNYQLGPTSDGLPRLGRRHKNASANAPAPQEQKQKPAPSQEQKPKSALKSNGSPKPQRTVRVETPRTPPVIEVTPAPIVVSPAATVKTTLETSPMLLSPGCAVCGVVNCTTDHTFTK